MGKNSMTADIAVAFVAGVLVMLVAEHVRLKLWGAQEEWRFKRDTYLRIISLLVEIHDLTRMIRSSYLAVDERSFFSLLQRRDPLFIDIDKLTVQAGAILQRDEIVDALVQVTGVNSTANREANEKLEQAKSEEESFRIAAEGLQRQVDICATSLKLVLKAAAKDLPFQFKWSAVLPQLDTPDLFAQGKITELGFSRRDSPSTGDQNP